MSNYPDSMTPADMDHVNGVEQNDEWFDFYDTFIAVEAGSREEAEEIISRISDQFPVEFDNNTYLNGFQRRNATLTRENAELHEIVRRLEHEIERKDLELRARSIHIRKLEGKAA